MAVQAFEPLAAPPTCEKQSVTDIFNEMFVTALELGMTYEQFWLNNPELYYYYLKAYNNKQIKKLKESDYNNWSLASYIARAVWADKKTPYLKEPRLAHYGEQQKTPQQRQFAYEQEHKSRIKQMCKEV